MITDKDSVEKRCPKSLEHTWSMIGHIYTVAARTWKKLAKFWQKGNERREKGTAEVQRLEPGGRHRVRWLIRALSHTSQPILPPDSYETMPSILHSLSTPSCLCCTSLMLLALSHQCHHCAIVGQK